MPVLQLQACIWKRVCNCDSACVCVGLLRVVLTLAVGR